MITETKTSEHTGGERRVSRMETGEHGMNLFLPPNQVLYFTFAQTAPNRWESVGEHFQNEADARLNAAAPMLLEALRDLECDDLFTILSDAFGEGRGALLTNKIRAARRAAEGGSR